MIGDAVVVWLQSGARAEMDAPLSRPQMRAWLDRKPPAPPAPEPQVPAAPVCCIHCQGWGCRRCGPGWKVGGVWL